jgi:hypothetical protein
MVDLDIAVLREKIELEKKYVDFNLIRTSLNIERKE